MIAGDRIRQRAADALATLHVMIVAFFALGWLLPWQWSWQAVIIGGIGLQIIWCRHDNQCPLTVLEKRLRDNPTMAANPLPAGTLSDQLEIAGTPDLACRPENTDEGSPHFVADLLTRLAGRPVSPFIGDLLVYGVLYASMGLAARRLWLQA